MVQIPQASIDRLAEPVVNQVGAKLGTKRAVQLARAGTVQHSKEAATSGQKVAVLGLLAWLWPALRQNVALLYYVQHLGTNLALATLFGRSLFGPGEALVTQFSRKAHSGVISAANSASQYAQYQFVSRMNRSSSP